MAKTYLEATTALSGAAPDIVIMDEAASIGGTWAQERIYAGLKTNNTVGSYEFSDFPMNPERYSLKPGQHIPGGTVHRYLCDFADHFGLTSRIRLRTRVCAATMLPDSRWEVEYEERSPGATGDPPSATRGRLTARRLVLATGLTSAPNIPRFRGQDSFAGPIVHSKQLGERGAELLTPSNTTSSSSSSSAAPVVVVVGANKSAWDVCYSAATAAAGRGATAAAHMVVRPSGGGPSRVWRPLRVPATAVRLTLSRLSLTRLCTWFDPWPFLPARGTVVAAIRRFLLHRTTLGRWVCALFWWLLDWWAGRATGYDEENTSHGGREKKGDGKGEGCAGRGAVTMLRPWTSTFWMGNSLSIHNYETDWFQLVREGRIVPHVADVEELDGHTVRLSDGSHIEADVLVTCTGWKSLPTVEFRPDKVRRALEPVLVEREAPFLNGIVGRDGCSIVASVAKARKQVLALCPELRSKPVRRLPTRGPPNPMSTVEGESESGEQDASLSRLYRFVVPPSRTFLENRNLAVIGAHVSIHAVMLAQAQALWITAFFHGRLPGTATAGVETMQRETLMWSEYERIRRPREAGGCGVKFPDLVFDSLPYLDVLLGDLGLVTRRKTSWVREILQPYTLSDYRGLVGEWLRKETGKG